jgi:ketosteroid isomerase-like protein
LLQCVEVAAGGRDVVRVRVTPYDNDYAVVFHVTGGLVDAVTEYCDTSRMKRVLFDQ